MAALGEHALVAICEIGVRQDARHAHLTVKESVPIERVAACGAFARIAYGEMDDDRLESVVSIALHRIAEYDGPQGTFGRRQPTERATGILMERHSIDEEAAFSMRETVAAAEAASPSTSPRPCSTLGSSCPTRRRTRIPLRRPRRTPPIYHPREGRGQLPFEATGADTLTPAR
jgi:hypothetical protein